jgi:hypothetical protein
MSKYDLNHKLGKLSEITLSVKGRKSRKNISRPVWFEYENSMLYCFQSKVQIQTGTRTCYLIQW